MTSNSLDPCAKATVVDVIKEAYVSFFKSIILIVLNSFSFSLIFLSSVKYNYISLESSKIVISVRVDIIVYDCYTRSNRRERKLIRLNKNKRRLINEKINNAA